MKRANPAQLRQSLEMANTMVKHGIRFVCMPVVDEADCLTGTSFTEDLAVLRKGAMRYEWLRDKQTFIWLIQDWFPSDAVFTDVDAVIDAAMGKGEQS